MSRLLVAAVLNDGQGSTNCVYISPTAAAPRFVNINGMIFTVRTDPTIPSGVICLNMLQRTSASVSTNANDSVDLAAAAAAVPAKHPVLGKVRIEMSYFSAAKTGGVIDYQQLIEFLGVSFSGQFFTVNQQVLCLFDGQKYKATVKEVEAVDKTGGLDVPSGVFTRETMVIIDCNEKSALKLINIPAAQTDAQREVQVKSFDLNKLGIGGLDKEFGQVFRRAFASRIYPPSIVKRLGIAHVKGVLLYGPPGTGKTLIARKIGEILNAKSVQIVNGPEVFNKWVGGAAENIRKLFAEAEEDQKSKGDLSPLHLIIFDEFDSIAKQRGGGGTSSNVGDEVVNQLLSKIDGVNQLNNVLLIGMTNRKDLIDEAILRPGRFEVHVEIGLPDLKGREQILNIHTRRLVENDALAKDVHIPELAELSKNFSGAELRGLVDAASSHAFARHVDMEDPTKIKDAEHTMIERADFLKALREDIKPAFGQAEDALKNAVRRGIIDYGPTWAVLNRRATELPARLRNSRLPIFSVLVHGPPSSGKTALAAHMAIQSGFPFVKFVSNPPLTGYGELQKCNILRRAFDDSYKSPLSVIVLDDIERLIEYSALGGRYSNTILQALLVLIKNPPPDGRKLLVIGTTSNRAALQDLELTGVFSSEIEAPALGGDALEPLARGLHCKWHSPKALSLAAASMPSEMPLKTLIQVIEVAADAPEGSGPEDERIITYERFSDALMLVGTGM